MVADHLTGRGLALSRATVRRVLAEAKVRPHKVRGWLNRADSDAFWSQAGAVCRLYLDIPADTLLVSIDEKTGIQARSRIRPTQPAAPAATGAVALRRRRRARPLPHPPSPTPGARPGQPHDGRMTTTQRHQQPEQDLQPAALVTGGRRHIEEPQHRGEQVARQRIWGVVVDRALQREACVAMHE